MARFQTAPDLWDEATRAALDAGTLILQPGQWVRLGDMLSRFYRHNRATGHIVAFHGPRGLATRKLREYVAGERKARDAALAREAERDCRRDVIPRHKRMTVDAKGHCNNRGGLPVWSGKLDVPAIGCEVVAIGGAVCCVTGYEICDGFLMVRGYRVADGRAGNLAGAEIVAK